MSIVRSCVRSVVRSPVRGVFGGDDVFGPASLFSSGAQGAWYDPSDFSTLFQNSTGTTPVTAVEQPVRLMLDRSRGLVLGGELVTNGGFDSDTVWTKGAGWTISAGVATRTVVADSDTFQLVPFVAGRAYAVTFTLTRTAGFFRIRFLNGSTAQSPAFSSNGTFTVVMIANSGNDSVSVYGDSAFAGSVDNISVRELPGNHALAPNDASRPVLRSRYNLLTYSEQFDNAGWGKTNATVTSGVADPFGGTKAFTLTATSNNGDILQSVSNPGGTAASITQAIWVRRRTGAGTVSLFNLNAGGITTITVTSSWQLFSVTGPGAASLAYAGLRLATSGDAVDIAFASLLTAADQTATGGAYQRIAAATDYDTSNPVWRPYLAFDGSDDSFSTSAIDFSGTDEMTVFAGVTKLSDAGRATVVELGTGSVATETFFINAPRNAATDNIGFASAGSSVHEATASGVAAPITRVVTGIGDISGDVATLRLNGVQAATNTGNQGTGNYANAALFIGRRNNMFDPLNGRLYSLAVLGRTATAAELSAMEAWVNGKTGAF